MEEHGQRAVKGKWWTFRRHHEKQIYERVQTKKIADMSVLLPQKPFYTTEPGEGTDMHHLRLNLFGKRLKVEKVQDTERWEV